MFSKDTKQLKWYYGKKMHTVTITYNGEVVDIDELYKEATKLVQDKEDLCKNIGYLGLGMTNSSDAGWGFLLGWLVRSIKKDNSWQIQHTEEDVPEEEVKEYYAEFLENLAKTLREGGDNNIKTLPTIGGNDGTDFFK